jgi:carboxyl-terminal processing protease
MEHSHMRTRLAAVGALIVLLAGSAVAIRQSGVSNDDRRLYKQVLEDIRSDLEKNYYDPALRGIDLKARVQAAEEQVAVAATTAEAVDLVTGVVFEFNDSHTRFLPPPRANHVSYGWRMAAVGDAAMVVSVEPGSDAAARGLAPGDRVLALNRFTPTRANLWQIRYYYRVVRPQARQHVVVLKPDGRQVALDIASKVERRPVIQVMDAFEEQMEEAIAEFDDDRTADGVLVWRMTEFRDAEAIGPFVGKARKAKAVVLDLRGNPGGAVDGLKALVGWMFDHDVQVMTRVGRKGETREVAKARSKPYLGRLVVLVDSGSASAAEIFARLVQLEKRGTVIGDRTAGAVMASRFFVHEFGIGNTTLYATSVTISDVRMPDGGSLEHVGVTPDELLLPEPADLAAGRDPVMARAVTLAGGAMTPEQAGKLFEGK